MKRITLLFENSDILVFNKPAGLAVQGGARIGVSLDSLLAAEYRPRPLLVHRLDQDTSGLILAAKNREAAARFSRLFAGGGALAGKAGGGLVKQYLALCAGSPPADSGRIDDALAIRGAEKAAHTAYKRRAGNGEFSLLELAPGTGRMHQIRRHLAARGNPVLGDDKYGDFSLNKRLRRTMGLRRLLLHAFRLIIPAGLAGPGPLELSAPLPDYFQPVLALFPPERPGPPPAGTFP